MHEVKLSSKNQIVIPRQVRSALGVKAGDKILIVTRASQGDIRRLQPESPRVSTPLII